MPAVAVENKDAVKMSKQGHHNCAAAAWATQTDGNNAATFQHDSQSPTGAIFQLEGDYSLVQKHPLQWLLTPTPRIGLFSIQMSCVKLQILGNIEDLTRGIS